MQIRKGPRLQKVIQGVLTVGNAVNVGTAYGNAQGIKLSSLLKLADVKVSSPVMALQLQGHVVLTSCAQLLHLDGEKPCAFYWPHALPIAGTCQ